ncbi:MAG: sulfatase [Bryobacterales bacterium]|nr:sulfatase [Bryobacterales bacterium]MDE0624148.1 sulfatase [Bryobacterales bacterium]
MSLRSLNRRQFFGTASALLPAAASVRGQSASRPPNIVFLMTDNHRWDLLGCAGNEIIQTPNIDRLAERGVRFINSFCTTSICAATRASILTGEFRREHGYTFTMPPMSVQRMDRSYPALLKQSGYRTGFVGKLGVEVDPRAPDRMFDFYRRRIASSTRNPYYREAEDGNVKHITTINGDDAVEFIRTSSQDQPFCLSVSFSAPHPEDDHIEQYIFDRELQALYAQDVIPPPPIPDDGYFHQLPGFIQVSMSRQRWFRRFDTPEKYQRMMKGMYRLITGVDRQVGRIVAELERRGFDDNTVVIFTGDNGIMIGEHGLTGIWLMYEGSIRKPLIIADPRLGGTRHAVTAEQMTLSFDCPVTMLDLAGVSIPEQMRGRSLVPLMRGETVDWREDFFYEHLYERETIPKSEGVRTERFKYVRYFERNPVYEQLFDLVADPDEIANLAGDPKHGATLLALRARCDELRDSVGGPYVRGM